MEALVALIPGLSTIFGGALGAIARLVPEFLKWTDRKDERAHELNMQKSAYEFQKLKGDQTIDEAKIEGDNAIGIASMTALVEAIKGQDAPLPMPGGRFGNFLTATANFASKIMRPLITFQWVVLLYPAVIIASFVLAINHGAEPLVALVKVFGPEEKALVAGIVNFWFLDRILKRA